MSNYPFELLKYRDPQRGVPRPDKAHLRNRPFVNTNHSLQAEAPLFVPGDKLAVAINAAIALGEPLLLTGDPGTGKTQAAYWVAHELKIKLLHFQVKSDTAAQDLLYHFDAVRYFYEANVRRAGDPLPDKSRFIEKRDLWLALAADEPCVLLIDEIDKAPRDFPNDLLHELDQMEFTVSETQEHIRATPAQRPLVFITSNNERRLPEPFLRRCVYHNIRFDKEIVKQAVGVRADEYRSLGADVIALAIKQFLALRERADINHKPSTGELLVWLRVLSMQTGVSVATLENSDLSRLPYLGTLLKDAQDYETLNGA